MVTMSYFYADWWGCARGGPLDVAVYLGRAFLDEATEHFLGQPAHLALECEAFAGALAAFGANDFALGASTGGADRFLVGVWGHGVVSGWV